MESIGVPAATHHLVGLLVKFTAADPRTGLLRISRFVRPAAAYGYQLDLDAASLAVKFVETYLSMSRSCPRSNDDKAKAVLERLAFSRPAATPEPKA